MSDADDKLTLTLIRGEIASLPKDDEAKVHTAAAQLRDVLQAHGQHGMLALALVGAEVQVMTI